MNKNKNLKNKPKFNTYWIYSLIVIFFISTYFIGGNEATNTSKNINITSFERFLNKGEIKNVTVINKNLAQVTLQRDALNSPDHKIANSTNILGQKILMGHITYLKLVTLNFFKIN